MKPTIRIFQTACYIKFYDILDTYDGHVYCDYTGRKQEKKMFFLLTFRVLLITLTLVNPNVTAKFLWGTRRCSWLRHCATSRKVAGSIPDGVTGIFH